MVGKPATGKFAEAAERETERLKLHKETRLDYMTYLMEINRYRKDAFAEGKSEGEEKGRVETFLSSIKGLMETTKWSIDQAMDAIKVPVAECEKYRKLLLNG